MMRGATTLDELRREVRDACCAWLRFDGGSDDGVVDPIENRVIGSHYSNSHLCAALLIGSEPGEKDFAVGVRLLRVLLDRWQYDSNQADFHHDFNNFALCQIIERLEDCVVEEELLVAARQAVLRTADSRHLTVNWLPMRIYVNDERLRWTGERRYGVLSALYGRLLNVAGTGDDLIEDRLPRGKSFNLQYSIASLAGLELLNRRGATYRVDAMLERLIHAIDPTGDINYLGRGCNQLFAWGPWIYLLRARHADDVLAQAVRYLGSRIPAVIRNENILLNDDVERDRYLWWDYHYYSVYMCHFLFWLEMAQRVVPQEGREMESGPRSRKRGSGLDVVRSEKAFIAVFGGRREYLAERGPIVANVWIERHGCVCKGTFGPWLGRFGVKYASAGVLLNFFGVLEALDGGNPCVKPVFARVQSKIESDEVVLTFELTKSRMSVMNLPLLSATVLADLVVLADRKVVVSRVIGAMRGQYGQVRLVQSSPTMARVWEVRIRL